MIALYGGKAKPHCSNVYLHEFAGEGRQLSTTGLHIKNMQSSFRLHCLSLDAPTLAYLTGIVNHGGYNCCPKCKIVGESVVLHALGMTKRGEPKKGVQYIECNAIPRDHDDYSVHYQLNKDDAEFASCCAGQFVLPEDKFDTLVLWDQLCQENDENRLFDKDKLDEEDKYYVL